MDGSLGFYTLLHVMRSHSYSDDCVVIYLSLRLKRTNLKYMIFIVR